MEKIFKNKRGSVLLSGGAVLGMLILAAWIVITPAYNGIRQDAIEASDLANARMVISATSAHNALVKANNETDRLITYDMLMEATIEEYNDISDIDINSLNNEDFNDAKEYICEDEYGDLMTIED